MHIPCTYKTYTHVHSLYVHNLHNPDESSTNEDPTMGPTDYYDDEEESQNTTETCSDEESSHELLSIEAEEDPLTKTKPANE